MDHVLRYQDTPGVKMIVVLGEVSISCLQYNLEIPCFQGFIARQQLVNR